MRRCAVPRSASSPAYRRMSLRVATRSSPAPRRPRPARPRGPACPPRRAARPPAEMQCASSTTKRQTPVRDSRSNHVLPGRCSGARKSYSALPRRTASQASSVSMLVCEELTVTASGSPTAPDMPMTGHAGGAMRGDDRRGAVEEQSRHLVDGRRAVAVGMTASTSRPRSTCSIASQLTRPQRRPTEGAGRLAQCPAMVCGRSGSLVVRKVVFGKLPGPGETTPVDIRRSARAQPPTDPRPAAQWPLSAVVAVRDPRTRRRRPEGRPAG